MCANNRTKRKKKKLKILKYKFLTFEDWIEFETICIAEHKMQTKFESSICFAESFTHLKFESKHFSRFVYNCNRFLSHFMKLDFFSSLTLFQVGSLLVTTVGGVLFMSNAASFKIDFQCTRRSSNRWENAFQPQFTTTCLLVVTPAAVLSSSPANWLDRKNFALPLKLMGPI